LCGVFALCLLLDVYQGHVPRLSWSLSEPFLFQTHSFEVQRNPTARGAKNAVLGVAGVMFRSLARSTRAISML
jgi:hypothetical protein